MARSRSAPPSPTTADSLADVVRTLSGQVEALTGHVDSLAQRVQVLTDAIDDIRDEIAWAVRNDKFGGPDVPVMHITSLPKDPLARDFSERINRYTAADVPAEVESPACDGKDDGVPPPHGSPQARQRGLWE